MNFKTTLVLLILLAVAGVAIWFTKAQPADVPTETKAQKLLEISAGDVQMLTITPADGKKIVAVREGTGWKLTEPVAAAADAGRINALLADIAALESQSQVDVTDGTGLNSARFVVEMAMKDGKKHTLRVGDRSAVGDRLYVQLAGNAKADMVPTGIDSDLERPLDDFREKKLLTLTSDQVKYVAIERPGGKLELTKENGTWTVSDTEPFKADDSAVSDLLFSITGLRATEFVQGDVESPFYGLNADSRKVTVSTAAPTTQPTTQPTTATVLFGRPDTVMQQNVFATVDGSGTIVKVSKSSTNFLDRTRLELRDKKVVDIDPGGVNTLAITIDSPATTQPTTKPAETKSYAVNRRPPPATQPATTQATTQPTPSTWITAEGVDAGDSAVDAILTALHPLRANRYVESAPTAGKTITVKLETGGGGVRPIGSTELRFIVPADGQPVGVYQGLNFEVDRSLIDKLEADITKPASSDTPEPESTTP